MGILDEQIAIVREFDALPSWEERYKRLIRIGRELPELPPERRTEDSRVRGCASNVWLHAGLDDGLVRYEADSDALIVRGLIALLLRVYSGRAPEDIVATEPLFVEELELTQHLSQTRANGLASMVRRIKQHALPFVAGRRDAG